MAEAATHEGPARTVVSHLTRWRPIEWIRAHPMAADTLLVALVVVVSLLNMTATEQFGHDRVRPLDALGVVLLLCSTVPLVWRRRAPRTALALNLGFTVPLMVMLYGSGGGGTGSLVAMYTVAAHCKRRDTVVAFASTWALMLPVLVSGVLSSDVDLPVTVLASDFIIFSSAWVLGDAVRNRRALVNELRFRAESAERQKAEEAARAVADERTRIAREMHDIVAHSMSVMIVQAGAARRVIETSPDHDADAAAALVAIEETGRTAMADMRRLLGVLRSEPGEGAAPLGPQPGLESLPALVEGWRDAGLAVRCAVEGTPLDLPSGIDVTAYRIVQEALTNVSKHAGPSAAARVTVTYTPRSLRLDVVDDGRGAAAAGAVAGGHGLVGMRERVALFGGTLAAGPRTGGGFAVSAELPLASVSAGAPAPLPAGAPAP